VNKKAYEAAAREAEKARCAVCGRKVTMADRCEDGLYLHVECARKASALPDLQRR
jgi:hypothetical protein